MNAVAPKISFVSLGCPKALVDSERIITSLRSEGYELSKSHAGADLVIINTCGFLDSAKAESLEAIGTELGISRERVRAVESEALAHLAEELGAGDLARAA